MAGLHGGRGGGAVKTLHANLIAPIQDQLGGRGTLYLVPDEMLFELPFDGLVDAVSGRALVEDFATAIVPSLALFDPRPTLSGSAALAPAAVFADPAFDSTALPQLERLGEALAGGQGIARSLGAQLFAEEEATPEAFLAALGEVRLLHYGGHALHRPERPELSALALAPGSGGASLLTAARIREAAVATPTELVVLSACDTLGTPLQRAEGPLGLSYPFLARGIPTVIASYRRVDDAATRALFESFYRHLQAGLPVPEALRRAKVATRGSGRAGASGPPFAVISTRAESAPFSRGRE